MNNQLPENNISQNDSEKTKNVFKSTKKLKIPNWVNWVVLVAVVLVAVVLVAGGVGWYYLSSKQEQTTKDYCFKYGFKKSYH